MFKNTIRLLFLFFFSKAIYAIELPADINDWQIFFRNMPKGADLHYHFSGSIYSEELIDIAKKKQYCLNLSTYKISNWSEKCSGIDSSLWLRDSANYKKLKRAWSLSEFHSSNDESTSDHFFQTFYLFGELVAGHQLELLQTITKRALSQNIHYLEIMMVPNSGNLPNYTYEVSKNAIIKWIRDNNKQIKNITTENLKNEQSLINKANNKSIVILFQQAVLREQPLESFIPQAIVAFSMAEQQKTTIGVNIVQPEQGVIAVQDYKKHMLIFKILHQLYPKAKLALHAGEINLQIVKPQTLNYHITEAIFSGKADRIGHGVSIAYEKNAYGLLNYMRKNKKAVEICLSSNRALLKTKNDEHPLPLYLKHKVPVVISTDDEGILRTDLSYEYWLAAKEYHLNYETIKQINRNSLTYSFIPGKSIWQDPEKSIFVRDCKQLNSPQCLKFVKNNLKSTLQHKLEIELAKFEADPWGYHRLY